MTDVKPSFLESVQLTLLLSVLAISVNFFVQINIVGDFLLFFGSLFVFVGMALLPFRYVLVIAVSCLFSQVMSGQPWPMGLLFLIEVFIIAILRHRVLFILLASILYWITIGIPTLWFFSYFNAADLQGSSLIITLQYCFNGLLNAAFASTIFACLPNKWLVSRVPKQHRLSSNIFALCASILVSPLLILSFLFIGQNVQQTENNLDDAIKNKSAFIGQLTSEFILKYQSVVENLANVISADVEEKIYQDLMVKMQVENPMFFNLTTVNKFGRLDFFAPTKYIQQIRALPDAQQYVRDRLYYSETKRNLNVYISDAILSRGVVEAPMISVAAPILSQGMFNGILYGAINLNGINDFDEQISQAREEMLVIITDAKNTIVYSSEQEIYKALTPLYFDIADSRVLRDLDIMQLNGKIYAYNKITTSYGWNVYLLEDAQKISLGLRDQFIIVGLGLLIVISVFLVLAYNLSKRITAPLIALLQDEKSVTNDMLAGKDTSQEISDMAKKLKRSSYLVKTFESRLKMQVEEKTEQLEQLNLQLAAQAREDGLTSLYNRSGFNELAINAIKTSYRLNQAFSIILLDLDNFKSINDTHGHLIGDECLIAFANLMQNHCKRETDIIGRYGGEEFIIFMSGSDIESQHHIINDIHKKVHFLEIFNESNNKKVKFTVSAGVCTVMSGVGLELPELINIADDELYKCKRNGRDRVSISTIG
ncbi:diguanylate cyclase [Glaciecola petra]|uniref:diguanylate cyclase n=1 Tax=Glaciecola petra TaxID=3075602 RepID=A0ABU2ZYL3_9ALTE|nr:diguanylate cyclase [Aestuariibacter sp. P117]MDT0596527.1 diguanylate cyclase [Aestuariibacter sp. P117]